VLFLQVPDEDVPLVLAAGNLALDLPADGSRAVDAGVVLGLGDVVGRARLGAFLVAIDLLPPPMRRLCVTKMSDLQLLVLV